MVITKTLTSAYVWLEMAVGKIGLFNCFLQLHACPDFLFGYSDVSDVIAAGDSMPKNIKYIGDDHGRASKSQICRQYISSPTSI